MTDVVLILNANYEPLHVCNLRRAMGLLVTDKASLVLNGRGEVRTTSQIYPRPSIIRLERMIQRPRPQVALNRREIFRRDGFTCQYCGKSTMDLTVDHITPRHLGGSHEWTNVVAACTFCNHRKGGRTIIEAGMHLLRPVKEPPANALYLFGRHLISYGEWEPYLVGW